MFLSLNLEKTKKNLVNRLITAPPWPIYSIFYGLFPRITQKSHSKTLDFARFFQGETRFFYGQNKNKPDETTTKIKKIRNRRDKKIKYISSCHSSIRYIHCSTLTTSCKISGPV
jgi:hypothetical protein